MLLQLCVFRYENIRAEVEAFFDVHEELGTVPGGIHLEMTGDNVTGDLNAAFVLLSALHAMNCLSLIRFKLAELTSRLSLI